MKKIGQLLLLKNSNIIIFIMISTQLLLSFTIATASLDHEEEEDEIPEIDNASLITARPKSLIESRSIALEARTLFDFDSNSNDQDSDLNSMESRRSSSVVISSLLGSTADSNDLIRNLVQRESRSDFIMNGCHCKVKEQVTTKRFFRTGRQKKFKLTCKCNDDQSNESIGDNHDTSARSNSMVNSAMVTKTSGSTADPLPAGWHHLDHTIDCGSLFLIDDFLNFLSQS